MRNKIVNELAEKLLAKEQECKELREDKIYTDMACEQLEKENNQLKADNEQLKKNYFTVIQQRNKAEKTLTEIKKIIKRCMKRIPLFEMKAIANDINEILKKISEVENV